MSLCDVNGASSKRASGAKAMKLARLFAAMNEGSELRGNRARACAMIWSRTNVDTAGFTSDQGYLDGTSER